MAESRDEHVLIEISWTTGSIDEARRVCRYLVQERLVASAQIIPWIESISLLNNQLETAQESKVLLKTRVERFEKIEHIIRQNSGYEVPEITYTRYDGCFEEYAKWIEESTPGDFATEKQSK